MANNRNHNTQGVALSVSNQSLSVPALDGTRIKGVVLDDFEADEIRVSGLPRVYWT